MRTSTRFGALLFASLLTAGTFTSCKDKETTVEETSTTTTTEMDSTSVPPVTEEIPGDTTTTGAPAAMPDKE